uniref:Uncharacterized protein n=1 Tax=Prolemur simus TaxID=1328070 RepID=A0A8C8ZHB4_PROSS
EKGTCAFRGHKKSLLGLACVCMRVCPCGWVCTSVCLSMCMRVCPCGWVCMSVCLSMCMHVWTCECVCTSVCLICTCVCLSVVCMRVWTCEWVCKSVYTQQDQVTHELCPLRRKLEEIV